MSFDTLKAIPSAWDSEVFQLKVGTLYVPTGQVLSELVREANLDLNVVFVKCKDWHDARSGRVAIDWRYDMELFKSGHAPEEGAVVPLEAALPEHVAIAESAFADSRFHRDPLLRSRVPEFYRRWLRNPRGRLWALEGNQEAAFLQTTVDADQSSRISLIGVHEKYRGLGIGERLAAGVMARFPAEAWRVTVASRNWRAIRFYEGLGFRMREVTTAFHVWI